MDFKIINSYKPLFIILSKEMSVVTELDAEMMIVITQGTERSYPHGVSSALQHPELQWACSLSHSTSFSGQQ